MEGPPLTREGTAGLCRGPCRVSPPRLLSQSHVPRPRRPPSPSLSFCYEYLMEMSRLSFIPSPTNQLRQRHPATFTLHPTLSRQSRRPFLLLSLPSIHFHHHRQHRLLLTVAFVHPNRSLPRDIIKGGGTTSKPHHHQSRRRPPASSGPP